MHVCVLVKSYTEGKHHLYYTHFSLLNFESLTRKMKQINVEFSIAIHHSDLGEQSFVHYE